MFELFRDEAKDWRWRLVVAGKVLAISEETWKKRSAAITAVGKVRATVAAAEIVEKLV